MSTEQIRDLGYLHPYVQQRAIRFEEQCKVNGFPVLIYETYRTDARQQLLYSQGKSQVKKTGAHGFCVALDFVPLDNKGIALWNDDTRYKACAAIAKELGFEWGGDWKSFIDKPHLQMLGGLTLAQWQAGKRPAWWDGHLIGSRIQAEIITVNTPNDIAYRLKKEGILAQTDYWMKRMEKEPNVLALCKNIANYTLTHSKGKDNTQLTTANDAAYRLLKAGIVTDSLYWRQRMMEDNNLLALGRKAAEWTL